MAEQIFTTLEQSKEIANGVIAKVKAKGYEEKANLKALAYEDEVEKAQLGENLKAEIEGKLDEADVASYTVKQQATAEDGYTATYQLFKVTGEEGSEVETAVGAKINIPKDYLVKSAELKTVTKDNDPVEGYEVGDKYIDFVVNTVGGDGNASHIYLLVSDLVDVYTAGTGIDISASNVVSLTTAVQESLAKADSALQPEDIVGGTNVTITDGTGDDAGKKVIAAADTTYTAGNGIDITDEEVSAVVDSANANGLSVGTDGIALATATAATAGAMSATDKSKLDNADVTAYTGSGAISVANHEITVAAATASTDGVGGNAGTISAADQEKLNSMRAATAAEVTAIVAALDNL